MYDFSDAQAAIEANDAERIAKEHDRALHYALESVKAQPKEHLVSIIASTYKTCECSTRPANVRDFIRAVTDDVVKHFDGITYCDPKEVRVGDAIVIKSVRKIKPKKKGGEVKEEVSYTTYVVSDIEWRTCKVVFNRLVNQREETIDSEISKPTKKNLLIGVRLFCNATQKAERQRQFIFFNF